MSSMACSESSGIHLLRPHTCLETRQRETSTRTYPCATHVPITKSRQNSVLSHDVSSLAHCGVNSNTPGGEIPQSREDASHVGVDRKVLRRRTQLLVTFWCSSTHSAAHPEHDRWYLQHVNTADGGLAETACRNDQCALVHEANCSLKSQLRPSQNQSRRGSECSFPSDTICCRWHLMGMTAWRTFSCRPSSVMQATLLRPSPCRLIRYSLASSADNCACHSNPLLHQNLQIIFVIPAFSSF